MSVIPVRRGARRKPVVDKPLKSLAHARCDAKPTVTFPAVEHHYSLTGTKLSCLETEAHVCEQLVQGCYQSHESSAQTRYTTKSHMCSLLSRLST